MTNIFKGGRALLASLLLLGGSTGLRADCGTNTADSPPDAALEVIRIAGMEWDINGGYYLGLRGERVKAKAFDPDLIVDQGKVTLLPPWPERVDWSVYVKAGANEPGLRFYFARHSDNSRRLCRVDEMVTEYNDNGEPTGRLVTQESWIYRYQAAGRLEEVLDVSGRTEKSRFSHCYLYDDTGYPAGRVPMAEGNCADARLIEAPFIYVHGLDGRLLRVISEVPQATTAEPRPAEERPHVVQTFDTQGKLLNLYAKDEGGFPYRAEHLPPTEEGGMRGARHDVIVMTSERWQVILLDPAAARKGNAVSWRFVRLNPEYLGTNMEDSETAVVETIAKGRTDRNGRTTLSHAQQRRLFSRMKQYPGTVMLRCPEQGMTGTMLLPGISTAQWDACMDPQQRNASACE